MNRNRREIEPSGEFRLDKQAETAQSVGNQRADSRVIHSRNKPAASRFRHAGGRLKTK